jgi:hypothetical protein
MNDDDAVAPVIAVMLILATIVTFLSVWNAVVLPSMKQSSEIEHLRNVESAFQHFSSDIEKTVSVRQDTMIFSEPVQLGGGDVMFDSVRSAGSLSVNTEREPVYNLTLYDGIGSALVRMNGTLAVIAYEPGGNFWQDQGYRWQWGFINVTKSGTRTTPLGYYNMTDVVSDFTCEKGSLRTFAEAFSTVTYTVNRSAVPGNCSEIGLAAINLSASPQHQFVSSNGFGSLRLVSGLNRTIFENTVSEISLGTAREPFGQAVNRNWNSTFYTISGICPGNIRYEPSPVSSDDITYFAVEPDISPVTVNLDVITIELGAY